MSFSDSLVVWIISYLAIVSRHMVNESWVMAKESLFKEDGISNFWLGSIDSSFMFFSTLGNLITGSFVDKYEHRLIIIIAISLSSLGYAAVSLFSRFIQSPWFFLTMISAQGIIQSPLYPTFVSLVGNYSPETFRGRSMGLLSTSICFGNFLGAFLTGICLKYSYHWRTAMLIYSFFQTIIGFFAFFYIKKKTSHDVPLLSTNGCENYSKKTLSLLDLLKIPYFKYVIVCKMCVKFLYYSLNMWLPFYLSLKSYDPAWVGLISGSLEIGGMAGAVICGVLSDIINQRSIVLQGYLFISLPLTIAVSLDLPSSNLKMLFALSLLGLCIGGTNLILITAIPVDLADHPSLQEYEVIGSITAILDASGSLGASLGIFLIGNLVNYGWVYYFIMVCSGIVIGFCLMLPYTLYEVKRKLRDIK